MSGSAAKVGSYVPPRTARLEGPGPDRSVVDALRSRTGLSSAAADLLDVAGLATAVPGTRLPPLTPDAVVVGRAVTLRYLPARRRFATPDRLGQLAHRTAFDLARPGDVLVISAPQATDGSVLGGEALAAARDAGIAGVVVDGAVRDLDELRAVAVPVWAARATPSTGRGRIEAVEINGPVEVGGVRVEAGDVVVADASGVSFVPADQFDDVARAILGG